MFAASCLLTEDQFLCSICLDVFTDPVSTPCGHNFCKRCIDEYWDFNAQCQCPNCKKIFSNRPELQVNTFISEMAAQFRQTPQQKASSSSSKQRAAKPGEVKAWVFNLLSLMCVVTLWMILNHKTHVVVLLKGEYEQMKAELGTEVQQMIQRRQLKIQEIEQSVKLSKGDADKETADGVQVFTALKESVERSQAELINTITEKQRKMEKQAEGFVKELRQVISELKKRGTEVEQLSRSEDHLHLLHSFMSLNTVAPTKDWTGVDVCPFSYEGTVVRAVVRAVSQLEKTLSKQMKKLFDAELKRVRQYAVDLILDPDTAHWNLVLSDDERQVHCGARWWKKSLPNNPERFSCNCVFAKQSFSSGRFYYEVQVKGNPDWILGVARESINRKGNFVLSPQSGYWTIWLRNKEYSALDSPSVLLSLESQLQKVGVFVDYEEGLVSFYDADAPALIYSFTGCSFTERLYPYFSLHDSENAAPLIISPIN